MALTDDEVLLLLDLELDDEVSPPWGRVRTVAWWLVLTLAVVAVTLVAVHATPVFAPPRVAG